MELGLPGEVDQEQGEAEKEGFGQVVVQVGGGWEEQAPEQVRGEIVSAPVAGQGLPIR